MPDLNESSRNRSFRIPTELLDLLEEESIDKDRSVNWLVVDAIRDKFKRPQPKVVWPAEGDVPVGVATYRVELRWDMPAFTWTDTLVDEAMTELCKVLTQFGAEQPIEVHGPEGVHPMPAKLEELPSFVTSVSGGDSFVGTGNSAAT